MEFLIQLSEHCHRPPFAPTSAARHASNLINAAARPTKVVASDRALILGAPCLTPLLPRKASNVEHIMGDAIPGKITRHPGPPFRAHRLQRLARHDHGIGKRGRKRFNVVIDPPAAALALQRTPGCAFRPNAGVAAANASATVMAKLSFKVGSTNRSAR